jgi:hypothetical protein
MVLVSDIVGDVAKWAPCLLIGQASIDYKRLHQGPICMVHNLDEVRDVISRYTFVKALDHPLVIDDLAYLNGRAISLLLKLIEESQFPIVLLSTHDRIGPVILSRVKTVVKALPKVESSLSSIKFGIARLHELSEDSHTVDKMKIVVAVSPMLYFLNKRMKVTRNRDKVLSLLE